MQSQTIEHLLVCHNLEDPGTFNNPGSLTPQARLYMKNGCGVVSLQEEDLSLYLFSYHVYLFCSYAWVDRYMYTEVIR